jgi:DNA-binding GntR family transcriptional regulator
MTNENLQPLIKRSAESLAVDALRAHVLSGAAIPGQRLTETALAAQLHVSRATVRTALHQLTVEGLVHQIPYTGWEVASLTAHDAWELYTLRSSLEALAARLAADRRGPETDTALRGALAKLKLAGSNRARIADADFGLHKTIIKLAQHRRLLDQYTLIEQQTHLYIQSSNALVLEPNEIIAQHAPIVTAILAGRGAEAARLSVKHNLKEGEKLVAHLNSRSAAASAPPTLTS